MGAERTVQNFLRGVIALAALVARVFLFLFFLDLVIISIPFILAFIANYLLAPVVFLLEQKNVKRRWAVTAVFIAFCLVCAALSWVVSTYLYLETASLAERSPAAFAKIKELFTALYGKAAARLPLIRKFDLQAALLEQGKLLAPGALAGTPQFVVDVVLCAVLTPVFTFFMLRDGPAVKRRFLSLTPNRYFETALNVINRINEQMGSYIRGRFYEAAIVGALTFIGIALAGLNHSGLYAFIAALTNIIPYIGPVLCVALGAFIALVDYASFDMVALAAVILSVIQLLDLSLIYPLAVGLTVRLHPVLVLLAVILGSQFLGLLGLILAVPVVSVIKVVSQELYSGLLRYRLSSR